MHMPSHAGDTTDTNYWKYTKMEEIKLALVKINNAYKRQTLGLNLDIYKSVYLHVNGSKIVRYTAQTEDSFNWH